MEAPSRQAELSAHAPRAGRERQAKRSHRNRQLLVWREHPPIVVADILQSTRVLLAGGHGAIRLSGPLDHLPVHLLRIDPGRSLDKASPHAGVDVVQIIGGEGVAELPGRRLFLDQARVTQVPGDWTYRLVSVGPQPAVILMVGPDFAPEPPT